MSVSMTPWGCPLASTDRRVQRLFANDAVGKYRKYAARNVNREPPGDPIPEFHGDTDGALVPGTECAIPEPVPMLPRR